MPMPACPVYCATKAAARSFTLSTRFQLRETSIKVIDIIPPAVQTDLHDYQQGGKQVRIRYNPKMPAVAQPCCIACVHSYKQDTWSLP